MEILTSSVAAPQSAPPPVARADVRPTADVAAMVRNPQPNIPLPIPANSGQTAAVVQAKLSSPADTVSPIDRVLKPYGVTMLPHGPKSQEPEAETDERAATPADNDAEEAVTNPLKTKAGSSHDTVNPAEIAAIKDSSETAE